MVGCPELMDVRCRSVEEMRLVNLLCPRGASFLLNPNRLNVAVSRAVLDNVSTAGKISRR